MRYAQAGDPLGIAARGDKKRRYPRNGFAYAINQHGLCGAGKTASPFFDWSHRKISVSSIKSYDENEHTRTARTRSSP